MNFKNEDEATQYFKDITEKQNQNWKVKTEVPCGKLIADLRIDEINEAEIVQRTICYGEVKIITDLKEILTGFAQCLYYAEQSGCEAWLILPQTAISKLIESGKAMDIRVRLYNLDRNELQDSVKVLDFAKKSRRAQAMETLLYKSWNQTVTIRTITPIGIRNLKTDKDGNVLFNIGSRARACIRECLKTKRPILGDAVKYGIYCEPFEVNIAKKDELNHTEKFVPQRMGMSIKSELYEVPAQKDITFTVHCMSPKLTPEIIIEAIRESGRFIGIGDSHSDGFHGRFDVIAVK